MKDYIRNRVLDVAYYLVESETTIREAAKKFKVSRSTIFTDITQRLYEIDANLADQVNRIVQYNKSERHKRGGMATKEKYEK